MHVCLVEGLGEGIAAVTRFAVSGTFRSQMSFVAEFGKYLPLG